MILDILVQNLFAQIFRSTVVFFEMRCVRGVVCMIQPRRYAFTPCGHRCVCHLCAVGITHMERRCPICRAQAGAEESMMESCLFSWCLWEHLAIPVACRWCASWELWTHEAYEARNRPTCLYGSMEAHLGYDWRHPCRLRIASALLGCSVKQWWNKPQYENFCF